VGTIKASQAAQALGLEAIDQPPDVDHILAQRVRRQPLDGLGDEGISRLIETFLRSRYCERFHTREYTKHLFASALILTRTHVIHSGSYRH
jgi:hypothetical protein